MGPLNRKQDVGQEAHYDSHTNMQQNTQWQYKI